MPTDEQIRNRIKTHRKVRAGARMELPHPPRRPLKLIDGHFRCDIGPDIEVEVLDMGEEEARKLLLRASSRKINQKTRLRK